ncbi:MAG: hypothetical protein DMG07_02975 [Acidobacteria bacterium]|nr:MAG: hypothetical protein DMG07_02975 [Acidobacteriota bacterium]
MKRVLSGLVAAAGALWLSHAVSPPLPAQAERPSVEEIARRSAEAQGGSERLRALRSLKLTGSLVTPPVDEGGGSAPKAASKFPALPVVFYLKLPDRVRMEMRAGGKTVVEVVTPESAHGASAGTLEGLVRAILTQLPDLVRPLGERSGGSILKLGGTERLGEREAYRVEVRHRAGSDTEVYIDTATLCVLRTARQIGLIRARSRSLMSNPG